jgi:hypothetical protein
MRILRGLSSRVLSCGCLTGLYETYDSEIVDILDAHAPSCPDPSHQPGATIARTAAALVGAAAAGDRPRPRPDPD